MFLDLCYCFLHFFIIYFCSELYGFFPSTNFGVFCSSFSSCFRDMVTSFIWYFSHFLRQTCIAISFSLSTAFGAPLRFWVFIVMCFWFFFWHCEVSGGGGGELCLWWGSQFYLCSSDKTHLFTYSCCFLISLFSASKVTRAVREKRFLKHRKISHWNQACTIFVNRFSFFSCCPSCDGVNGFI